MPYGDGSGPLERGSGRSRGSGRGGGRGKMSGNRSGAGLGGVCVCPSCGSQAQHQQGVPCYSLSCPQCGSKMARG